jgi:hypothetical protein
MSAFVEKCQNMQVRMEHSCSVKRWVVELSPSVVPPSKQLSVSGEIWFCLFRTDMNEQWHELSRVKHVNTWKVQSVTMI